AMESAGTFNRIQAIMLLQPEKQMYKFLHRYFVSAVIDEAELERYYKLSFLGMTFDQISNHEPETEYFDDMLASLSMADVYHTDAKRDAFNLLLRLNIDEDIKLGRKFDFNVWNKRSLEHIYSKSKVWHTDESGKVFDGNDRELHGGLRAITKDPTFMPRDRIVNRDGTRLSEHCIGNLVLLYGENNARFGNAGFEQKKMMFLAPGDMTVFESRNLLHSVCIFAGNSWNHQSIVDNYNLTLKNLKQYYGYK
ncbi:MAG: HNH endonuclease family protein, partial [Muribaculaceae bacterium]|nr:HNH endonuclease family protein [Muribaculaceae bacterium]